MKRCSRCKEEKKECEFGACKTKSDGLYIYCKYCAAKISWERNNKDSLIFYDNFLKNKLENVDEKLQLLTLEKKICFKCGNVKDVSNFSNDKNRKSGLDDWCKECKSIKRKKNYVLNKEKELSKNREYMIENREKISKRRRKHYEDNKDLLRKKSNNYYYDNKEIILQKHTIYCRKRYKEDLCYKLRYVVSRNINHYIKLNGFTKNRISILQYLPYTMQELKQHLESQFEPWMSWDNYGKVVKGKRVWHIDHIIPQSLLPYDNMKHPNFQKCWALENLRPLEAVENIKKGNKIL